MVAYTYSRSSTSQAGWLHKESSGFRKNFHKRWFVLKGNELRYFKTEEDSNPHGVINLNDYKTILPDAMCKKSPFAFVLQPRNVKEHKSYLIFADSHEEMSAWMKAIQSRVGPHDSRPALEPDNDRSVLDKWLDRLDLCSPSFESSRSKTLSPTSSTFSKNSSEFDSKHHLQTRKSNSSLSSDGSLSSSDSGVFSESESSYKEKKARQQVRDKLIKTTSMPPIMREPTDQMDIPVITSAPSSPTFNLASRRNIQLSPLPLKSIILTMESNQISPFLQANSKVETDLPYKRRSNSVPRFDCLKTGCITPTFGM